MFYTLIDRFFGKNMFVRHQPCVCVICILRKIKEAIQRTYQVISYSRISYSSSLAIRKDSDTIMPSQCEVIHD